MALKINKKSSSGSKKTLESVLQIVLSNEETRQQVAQFGVNSSFVEFAPTGTVWEFDVILDAVQKFLLSGEISDAVDHLRSHFDTSDILEDLYQDINRAPIYHELAADLTKKLMCELPQLDAVHIGNKVSEAVFSLLLEELKRQDSSGPLDVLRGSTTQVVYSPQTDNKKPGQALATDWWGPNSDAVSIKPDRAFIEFMIIANVSKEAWLAALADAGFDLRNDGDLSEDEKRERAVAWAQANWSVQGQPLVDVNKIVDAVDMCPYGFTPSVTFAIDAHQLVTRDWSKVMEVTGGILGLHDFDNGSGSPLRFEETCFLPVEPKNLILHDNLEHNIAACHGLRSEAFSAKVTDGVKTNQTVDDLKRQIDLDRNAPQVNLATIATTALINFKTEIDDLAEDMLATDLDISAIDAALIEALDDKCKQLSAKISSSDIAEAVRMFAESQRNRLGQMDQRDKIAALIGLTDPEQAAAVIHNMAGLLHHM